MKRLWQTRHTKKLLFLPPVIVGAVVLAVVASRSKEMPRRPVEELSRVLRVIEVPQVSVVPRVLGFGTAKPRRVWQAVPEVSGRIIAVHDELRSGAIIRQDDELFRIDPVQFDLAIQQIEADIQQANAQLAELDAREKNSLASLQIEQQSLEIAEKDLARHRNLVQQNAAASAEVERAQRAVLNQRQLVQNHRSALNLFPAQRTSLEASLAAKQVALRDAQRNLANTVVAAPFTCRLGDVNLDVGQFVTAGMSLFETDGIDTIEIDAQVPLERFIEILDVDASEYDELLAVIATFDLGKMRQWFTQRSKSVVRVRSGKLNAEWDAKLSTVRERIDPQTRTVGIVVEVENPMQKIIPGQRPLLTKGMFCEIELRGSARPRRLVVPRLAIHDNHVYVLDSESKLERREVELEMAQGSFAVVQAGLAQGETLVVSDPTPAVIGLRVKPIQDDDVLNDLVNEATGLGVSR